MGGARTVLWKELKDLSRDYRTLVAVVVLPLIGLPGLALLTGVLVTSQTISLAIVVEDPFMAQNADLLVDAVNSSLQLYGVAANISLYTNLSEVKPGETDVLVYIPNGFYNNLSKIDGQARVIVSILIGSQASELARQAVETTFSLLSQNIVRDRVLKLSDMASVEINPEGLLNPIVVQRGFHKVTGAPATGVEASVAQAARILEFSLFFVVNPTVVFMTDSIVGEKERKTIEKLLMAPISRRSLLLGKLAASGILGLLSAIADGIGIIAFFQISGTEFTLSPTIIIVWFAAVVLLVLTTAPLIVFIASRSESVRAAQNASFLVVMIALAIYFSTLMVDLSKLPGPLSLALSLVPFTHAALMIHNYALGEVEAALLNATLMAGYWILLTLIAARSFSTEKLVMYKS